jgi:hypothetical protein
MKKQPTVTFVEVGKNLNSITFINIEGVIWSIADLEEKDGKLSGRRCYSSSDNAIAMGPACWLDATKDDIVTNPMEVLALLPKNPSIDANYATVNLIMPVAEYVSVAGLKAGLPMYHESAKDRQEYLLMFFDRIFFVNCEDRKDDEYMEKLKVSIYINK